MENKPVAGDTVKFLSIIGVYNGVNQLQDAVVVEITPMPDEEKVAAVLAGLTVEEEVIGGGNITLTNTTAYSGVTITWALDQTHDNATLTGNVLALTNPAADTTVTVVATVACGETTETKTFTIQLRHVADGTLTEKTLELSFADKVNRTEFSTAKQVWVQNGITFTNNKSSSTTNIADYAKPVRLYANSEIVIECSGIKKIVIDCNSSSYATALKNSFANGVTASATYTVTVSSDKVTIELDGTVDSFTIKKLSAQVRVDSITVTAMQ